MAGEYDVDYLASWQGYEQPTDKTVQELEVDMQKALANAAQLTAEQQAGVIYMDADGRLILPLHSIVGYLHIRDATINSANIMVAAIGTAHIQDANITRAKIQHAAIGTAEIADASIVTAKIENATITTAKIANAAITTALIDTGAITTAQIANGSITDAKIVSLVAGKITSGTIDTGQVDLSGPAGKLRITGNRVQVFDTSAVPVERVAMGDVFGNGSVYGFLMRAADGYTTMIDTTGVKSAGITDGAITNPKIGNGAVMNNNIYANTITGNKLVAEAITAREIAAKTITANEIAAQTITSASGLIGQISASDITTGTLTGATIRGANIYGTYIEGGTISGTSITGASLVGGVITSSNSQSRFSLTAGEAQFYNNNNGSYINLGPAGLSGYNVADQKAYALNSTFVETEAVRTTNKNTYLVTKYSPSSGTYGEVRCVLDIGVPGTGNYQDYTYAVLRAGNMISNGSQVITAANIDQYNTGTGPDLSAYATRTWVTDRGYVTGSTVSSYLSAYATSYWVETTFARKGDSTGGASTQWVYDNFYQKSGFIVAASNSMTITTSNYGPEMIIAADDGWYVKSRTIRDRSYSGSGNVYCTTEGTLGKVGSTRAIKYNIEDMPETVLPKILQLRPRTWHDKRAVDDYADYLDQVATHDRNDNEAIYIGDSFKADHLMIERITGLIAEEVEALGLEDFVVYGNPDPETLIRPIESVMYDRLWIPLVPVVKNHDDRLRAIEEVLGITA